MVFMQSHEYFPVYGAVSGKNDYALQLLVSPGDPSFAQIIRGKLHRDPSSTWNMAFGSFSITFPSSWITSVFDIQYPS